MARNFTSEVCSENRCSFEMDLSQVMTTDVINVDFYAGGNLISNTTIGKHSVEAR